MSICLNRVSYSYGAGVNPLKDLTIVVKPGEFVGIIGPNGSGKSTIARLLNGALKPTFGTVIIDGCLTTESEYELAIKHKVATVLQEPENQIIAPTVWDEISLGLETQGLSLDEIRRRCESAIANCQLEAFRDIHPLYLSTGEQIKVLLAAALARQPRYLVLDEVYSTLDGPSRQGIAQLIDKLRVESGLGIVLLTHRLEELSHADRLLVLLDGHIAMDALPADVFMRTLSEPTWQLEAPLSFQVYHFMSPGPRAQFKELHTVVSDMFDFTPGQST
jgi:energy-coupling factor transport system ATP-binding protein